MFFHERCMLLDNGNSIFASVIRRDDISGLRVLPKVVDLLHRIICDYFIRFFFLRIDWIGTNVRQFISKIIIARTFAIFTKMVNSIRISNNNITLSDGSDQFGCLIYSKRRVKRVSEK